MTRSETFLEQYRQVITPLFRPDLVLERGQGAYVWDPDGIRYLDLMSGIAVTAIGHAHPAWVRAVAQQAGVLAHTSNLYANEPQIALAAKLLELAGAGPEGKVYFGNSGAEANEAALKTALLTGKHRVLALDGSFHGRTLGALSLTHKEAYRKPYDGFTGQVQFLPAGDLEALEMALREDDVAVLCLEVIQGERGVVPLPPGYVAAARRLTREHGALLWIDEVQTGIGRTGAWFAYRNPALVSEPVVPDLVTAAKALGGGFPIGACLMLTEPAASLFTPGLHGTTFGGGPLACAAALATLGVIEHEGLLEHARVVGDAWRRDLSMLDGVTSVRGQGQHTAFVLEQPVAPQVVALAAKAGAPGGPDGFLINATGPDTLRLAPALILTAEQAATFTAALPGLLAAAIQEENPS
ncbi:MAG: acetylornithine transaminase [Bifidobacteriaceae bacterium]|jgi:acetylornithine aminotransferase|nr:acetylornithine transaminase [Bifidobacteriaceae bacterium]